MNSKVLVIIATGEAEKAMTGLMYAQRTMSEGWLDQVRVMFFGPSERLLVENEDLARQISATQKPIACKFLSDRDGISEKIEALHKPQARQSVTLIHSEHVSCFCAKTFF